ncbi:MAG: OsmC family protein [Myxococcota bacterium]
MPRQTSERGEQAGGKTMRVQVRRTGPVAFEATTADGQHPVRIDGPATLGGSDGGMRPMELFLVSLATCSAMDVVMILDQQRQTLEDLDIEVEGKRADAVPAVYERIHLRFIASGDVAMNKLERAVKLSAEKYCSVSRMLLPSVEVTHEAVLKPAGEDGA